MKRFLLLFLLCSFFFACGGDEAPTPPTNTPPIVGIDPLTIVEGDAEKTVLAVVRLSKASEQEVLVFVESEDGTAEAGEDYSAISQSILFQVGSVQESIELTIFGETGSELNESFVLKITEVSGALLGQNATVTVVISDDDTGSGVSIIPETGYSTPETYDGMEMIWSDEFDGDALDESVWCWELGNGDWGWGNNELEYYRKENTTVEGGYLIIKAKDEDFGGRNYTSSRIKTQGKFSFTHGRVDIRAVLPKGQGIWPALWMLGDNITSIGWPRCGEIDIMELIGHLPSTVHGTVHYANDNGDHIFVGDNTSIGGSFFSDEFHVFSIIWEEDRIEFFLDDVKYHTITKGSLGLQHPYPFNDPFFFIFNVAVGGTWPGSPDNTTSFPQQMVVDYVRVFQPN